MLSYYKSETTKSAAGQIDCNGCKIEPLGSQFSVCTAGRVLTVRAASDEDAMGWIVSMSTFADTMKAAKPLL